MLNKPKGWVQLLAYGRGPASLAAQIGCTLAEAKDAISKYFAKFCGVGMWLDRAGFRGVRDGYTRTMSNRIRYFEFNRGNRRECASVARESKNSPIQGTCADILKTAMYMFHERYKNQPQVKLINCVHDELNVECPEDIAEEVCAEVKFIMEEAGRKFLKICPVVADAAVCNSLAEK